MNKNYVSLNDHVCSFISEQIFSGKLRPGERINENLLCEKLNVSRTPIREALIQLSSEGLIEKIPRKGFYAKKLRIKEANEIYSIIGILDAEAAGEAMEVMDESTLGKMSQLYEQLCVAIKYKDLSLYKDLQKEFHKTYINLCNNTKMLSLLEHLKFSIDTQIYYTNEKDELFNVFQHYNEEHKLIIEYFKQKAKAELTKLLKEKHWKIKYTEIIDNK